MTWITTHCRAQGSGPIDDHSSPRRRSEPLRAASKQPALRRCERWRPAGNAGRLAIPASSNTFAPSALHWRVCGSSPAVSASILAAVPSILQRGLRGSVTAAFVVVVAAAAVPPVLPVAVERVRGPGARARLPCPEISAVDGLLRQGDGWMARAGRVGKVDCRRCDGGCSLGGARDTADGGATGVGFQGGRKGEVAR